MNKDYLDVPFDIKAENVGEDGLFEGYGSTFGKIPDSHRDVVVEGAFSKSLSKGGRNGTGVAMLYHHRADKPIGVWRQLVEDNKGLKVVGQLAMKTQIAQEASELMKMGAIKGLSIGFNAVEDEYDSNKKIRYLKEVDLWEISLVTFPANTQAKITAIKAIEDAKTVREIENALRDAGLSKSESAYIACRMAPSLREAESTGVKNELSSILDSLKEINETYVNRQVKGSILESLRIANR